MSDPSSASATASKWVVLDDDPTGCQTVHSCPLLTRWGIDELRAALTDPAPLFFVLTNTRALPADRAAAVTRAVCQNLARARDALARDGQAVGLRLVSRSDSTLRGHFPVETDALNEALGPFDALFLVPAFLEGGRITRDGIHYVVQGADAVPAHETEFAQDSVFGYRHSYLPDYVEEKTAGRIPADRVTVLDRAALADPALAERLAALRDGACCAVDAVEAEDLDRFAAAVETALGEGKRFLFRSGASLVKAVVDLPSQPLSPASMHELVRSAAPGVVLVGSYVAQTSRQLEALFTAADVTPIEVSVDRVETEREALEAELIEAVARAHADGRTPVVFTSRAERRPGSAEARLALGVQISEVLMQVVRNLPATTGFLISKGGITSNDTLSQGLALGVARLQGQIAPGCSVVRCPDDHPRYPGLPVVIFPGNVGDEQALLTVYRRLRPLGPDPAPIRG